VAKVMEIMITERLKYVLETQLLEEEQTGFRMNSSTMHQVRKLTEDIKEAFNQKKSVFALFVDFQTAYDIVWQEKLLNKIKTIGIRANMYSWIRELITQRWSNILSKWKETKAGLPQGTISSPTPFNLYINDLPKKFKQIQEIKIGMFAVDVVIYTTIDNRNMNTSKIES
jgi:hypothetical protein